MGESSNRLVLSGLLCCGALVVGGFFGWSDRPQGGVTDSTAASVASASMIDVHVAGLVANPGVVSVPEGAIVADAVAAAGGLLVSSDPDGLNLAAPLSAGQQIVVPGRGAAGVSSGTGAVDRLISLNQATEAELEELPGVGPVLAERIVSHRDIHGPFQAVEDLLQVPGIGEAKFASIRDLVRP